MRPPSIGRAGIRLNKASTKLASKSLTRSGFSGAPQRVALKSISALKKLGEIDDISLIDVLLYRMSVLNKKPFTKSSIIEVLSLVSNEKSKYVYEKLSKIRVDEGSDMNNKIVLDELKDTLKILNKKMSKK